METWKIIDGFPNYAVSDRGAIRNEKTYRILQQNLNQYGVPTVGLMRDNGRGEPTQFHRSVTLCVANAFLWQERQPAFDTPINLDGDRTNNDVNNLMWRPRWFAIKYNRQFKTRFAYPIVTPIRDKATRRISENSLHAAMRYGLLERDIVMSIANRTVTWPTYQEFEIVED